MQTQISAKEITIDMPKDALLKIDYAETFKQPKYKSTMKIGNVQVNNIKHFNWIQKKLWKLLLNIEIEDI